MLRRDSEEIVRTGESLGEDDNGDVYSQWIAGVIFPLLPVALAVYLLLANEKILLVARLLRRFGLEKYEVSAAVILCSVACFLHFHYFWTPSWRFHEVGRIGKGIALLAIAVAAIGAFLRVMLS